MNVIIHLEVKLNCKQILKNTCLPKVSIYILTVLCYKNEQKISFTYHHNMKKFNIKPRTEIINAGSDASYIKSDTIRFSSTYKNISSVEQL